MGFFRVMMRTVRNVSNWRFHRFCWTFLIILGAFYIASIIDLWGKNLYLICQ